MDLVTTELIVEKADTECEASAVITSIATDFIVDLLIELDLEKVNNLLVRVLNCILLFQPATRQFEVKEDVNVRERHFFQLLTRVRSQIMVCLSAATLFELQASRLNFLHNGLNCVRTYFYLLTKPIATEVDWNRRAGQ